MTKITNEIIQKAEIGKPKKLVFLLHGVGSNSNDLISLTQYLDRRNFAFISPDAPFTYDMAPIGYQWFSLKNLDEESLFNGLVYASEILRRYIDEKCKEFEVGIEDCIFLGFSQGAMLSLYTVPRLTSKAAGIISISGALLRPELLKKEAKHKPETLLMHGDLDEVVPFVAFEDAKKYLTEMKFPVMSKVMYGAGHHLDPDGINEIISFLNQF